MSRSSRAPRYVFPSKSLTSCSGTGCAAVKKSIGEAKGSMTKGCPAREGASFRDDGVSLCGKAGVAPPRTPPLNRVPSPSEKNNARGQNDDSSSAVLECNEQLVAAGTRASFV